MVAPRVAGVIKKKGWALLSVMKLMPRSLPAKARAGSSLRESIPSVGIMRIL
jgi:hypothetical protein